MSDKPDFNNEKGQSVPTEIPEPKFPGRVRNWISATLLGGTLLLGGSALADRFNILDLIDTSVRDKKGKMVNLAEGQDPYDILPSKKMQPYLFPSDDVSKKDRDKMGLDIDSPSIPFELIKRIQSHIKSRFLETRDRLKTLEYIKRNSNNFEFVHKKNHKLHDKHLRWKDVYDHEFPVNTELLKKWDEINKKMEPLRKKIKDAVMTEVKACKSLKRCAVEQPDLSQNDFLELIPVKKKTTRPEQFDDYSDIDLPPAFELEPFNCVTLDPSTEHEADVTDSEMYEDIKYLEKIVIMYITAVKEREEDYLQIEKLSKDLGEVKVVGVVKDGKASTNTGKINANKREKEGRLRQIYTNGRKFNESSRKKWHDILSDIVTLKQMIAKAEFEQTQQANRIERCEKL